MPLAVSTLLLAAAAAPLQPVGKWEVASTPDDCTMTRSFGDPARPVILALNPGPAFDDMNVLVIVAGSDDQTIRYGSGSIALAPTGTPFAVS